MKHISEVCRDVLRLVIENRALMERIAGIPDDGFAPDSDWQPSPAEIRKKHGLTQEEMTRRLRIPLGTWRNWEQGRVKIRPHARALLLAVWRIPRGDPRFDKLWPSR